VASYGRVLAGHCIGTKLNQFGQGQVVYVGTLGDAPLYEVLAGSLTWPKYNQSSPRWMGSK